MTSQEHNKLLSIFFGVQGGLQLLGGIIALVMFGGMGTFMATAGDIPDKEMMGGLFIGMAIAIGILTTVFAGFYLLTAWKLHKGAKSGRIMGIIASCLGLLSIPLGTALGIYGLWFLMGEEGTRFYSGLSGHSDSPPPPPAANSWQ